MNTGPLYHSGAPFIEMPHPHQARLRVLNAIWRERDRQIELRRFGKFTIDVADPKVSPALKLAILSEEFGEAAQIVNEIEERLRIGHALVHKPAHLGAELTQLGAVSVAWLESLHAL